MTMHSDDALFTAMTISREKGPFSLKVGPETDIVFDVQTHMFRSPLGFYSYPIQFMRRLDVENWPVMLPINGCASMPIIFHAGMHAFAVLVRHTMEKHRVYEGEADQGLNVRGIMQGAANVYGVDVNALPRVYGLVRPWLTSRSTSTPSSFHEMLALLRAKGHSGEINLKGAD